MRLQLTIAASALCAAAGMAQDYPKKGEVAPKTQDVQKKQAVALADTRWYVEVTPEPATAKAGEKAFSDVFVFDRDKVTLAACLKNGFAPSTYQVIQKGGKDEFATTQVNDKAARASWEGEVAGEAIKGKLTLTKPGAEPARFSFRGWKSTVLEGTTWDVTVQPGLEDEDAAPRKAQLVFDKGMLVLADANAKKSAPLRYTLTRHGEGWKLSGKASDGALVVNAEITGTMIKGTTEEVRGDEEHAVECSFNGRRTLDAAAQPAVPHR